LYIISQGSVEVIQELEHPKGRTQRVLATLGPGEIFGELALLQQTSRTASVRCLTGVDVLVVRRGEFGMLAAGLTAFRENLQRLATQRLEREKSLDAVARPVATEERASEIRQHDPDRHMPPPKNQSEG
jgi:CRP-like cAMP-binding protein